ncbi:MAG: hypothetical protein RLZ72_561 [Actinomycetota bacterium]|jgi:phosphatidate phosphatase APP1
MHRLARLEDGFIALRSRMSEATGHVPTVVPFRGFGTTERIRILARVLYVHPDPSTRKVRKVVRGWRAFTSVPVANQKVTVRIGERSFTVSSDRGGVVDALIDVELSPGWHDVEMRAKKGEGWTQSEVLVLDPKTTTGIVSDIDDTVMVTSLPRLFLAGWNTFVLDENARRPVPGMPVLLNKLAGHYDDAPTVYLSTGPWNIAPTLERFLSRHMYPKGPFLLTDWGATPDRAFRSGREHKSTSLERLATEFPTIKWILVGDDGQHDETLYGNFATTHPDNVRAVVIRRLSTPEAVLAGAPMKHPNPVAGIPWVYGHNGAEIAEQLRYLGILGGTLRH